MPTLVLATSGDPIHPWATAAACAARLPRAALRRVPSKDEGAGVHYDTIARELEAFMDENHGSCTR
jgi:hypothetical protein